MKVRMCVKEDVPAALELVEEFYKESIEEFGLFFNKEVALLAAEQFINTSFILERDEKVIGLLSGTISQLPLSNEKVYQEAIWYVKKEHRAQGINLYYKLEDYCREQGINKLIMVSMSNSRADKLDIFYHRLGFQLLEKHYIKIIGG